MTEKKNDSGSSKIEERAISNRESEEAEPPKDKNVEDGD